jgi:fermentation-respiration switch protein FrsA (DUF1100 family)
MTREDIEFKGERDVTLRGWFYPARNTTGPAPVIVLSHGLTAVKEMHMGPYAEAFADAGLNALVYDHQNFGDSDGQPRQEVDPILQYRDYRNAISYACTRSEVDASKVGVWGSSFSGGLVLAVGANDRRVKAVVSQVPFISGPGIVTRMVRPDFRAHLLEAIYGDRQHRYGGGEPHMLPAVTPDPLSQALMAATETHDWFTKTAANHAPNWKNEVTLRSFELIAEWDPGATIDRISPTPLLMIVTSGDVVAPYEQALEAYEHAREPKQLLLLPGGHFDLYEGDGFATASAAARDHFLRHLVG